jgi:regulatory protein
MSGTITALVVQKKNKDRVNVYLDGEFAFGLAAIEAIRLKRGQLLSDKDIDRLRGADEVEKAHNRALNFLAVRPRSVSEVRQNLKKGEFEIDVIDQVIDRLKRSNLLNDADFIKYWLENRSAFSPRSARALKQELMRKGVDRDAIDQVLGEVKHDEDGAATRSALAKANRFKQLPQKEFTLKLSQYLARRGFGYETIREAVAAAWRSIHETELSVDQFNELEE